MKATIKRRNIERYPNEVNMNYLYAYLLNVGISNIGRRIYKDYPNYPFLEQDVVNALADQGIQNYDMKNAIQYCVFIKEILEKRDNKYFLVSKAVDSFLFSPQK
jgi:hypothetical protein